jgi:hypothetical protein
MGAQWIRIPFVSIPLFVVLWLGGGLGSRPAAVLALVLGVLVDWLSVARSKIERRINELGKAMGVPAPKRKERSVTHRAVSATDVELSVVGCYLRCEFLLGF